MEKINIWEEAFKIRSYQMDMKGKATITGIAGYLQEVAGNHAHYMGFGYRQMKESGLLWLLTRVKINVQRYPIWGEEIKISTWVVNAEKYFSRRDFEILDTSGKIIISAISGWMLVNAREKKPQLVESLSRNIDLLKDKLALEEEILKIESPVERNMVSSYKVKFSDIDVVNHVNNIQYYNIILDSLPDDLRKNFQVKKFEINYLAESLLGDGLEITTQIIKSNENFVHEIRRISDNKAICRAVTSWQKE